MCLHISFSFNFKYVVYCVCLTNNGEGDGEAAPVKEVHGLYFIQKHFDFYLVIHLELF